MTGTLSIQTTASSGNIKVYVNGGTPLIDTTISTSAMTGGIGLVTLGNYTFTSQYTGCPRPYNFATLDNFFLERN